MKLLKLLPILFVLIVGCAASTNQQLPTVEENIFVDRHILYTRDYDRHCNDLQADFLFMFDSKSYEAQFIDYGTRSTYRIGQRIVDEVPKTPSRISAMPERNLKSVRWYTSVDFLSFGDKCSVSVRGLNNTKNDTLNGNTMIKLLRQLDD